MMVLPTLLGLEGSKKFMIPSTPLPADFISDGVAFSFETHQV